MSARVVPSVSEAYSVEDSEACSADFEARAAKVEAASLEASKLSGLYAREYAALRLVQCAAPYATPLALAVHYGVSAGVVLVVVALTAWLVSLAKAATLASFVAFNVAVNLLLKWIVQRPRPSWLTREERIVNIWGTVETDYSFPSGHTQVVAGTAACGVFALELPLKWLALALGLGIAAGFSRNYLAVHFCTDTLVGLLLGFSLGILWGISDPYGSVLQKRSPLLSLGIATVLLLALGAAMAAAVRWSRHADEETLASWLANATDWLPEARRKAVLEAEGRGDAPLRMRRSLFNDEPLAVLSLLWCVFALTGTYPGLLPEAELADCRHLELGTMALRALLGFGGLAVWVALLHVVSRVVGRGLLVPAAKVVCALCGVSVWVFLLSHLAFKGLKLSCEQ